MGSKSEKMKQFDTSMIIWLSGEPILFLSIVLLETTTFMDHRRRLSELDIFVFISEYIIHNVTAMDPDLINAFMANSTDIGKLIQSAKILLLLSKCEIIVGNLYKW